MLRILSLRSTTGLKGRYAALCTAASSQLPQSYPNPATTPARDFRFLRNENELLIILDRLGDRLTGYHLAAALSRANQLNDAAFSRILPVLTERSLGIAAHMSAHDVIFLLVACNRSRDIEKRLIEALMERLMHRECLLQLNGNLMAECLTALAGLQSAHGVSVFDLAHELARLFVKDDFAKRLTTPTFVKIISAFGSLRLRSPSIQRIAGEEGVKPWRLEDMRLDELVRLWTACSDLQITDASVLGSISSAVAHPERLTGFSSVELTMLIAASHKLLPFRDPICLEKLFREIIKPDRLHELKEVHLATLFEAMSDFKVMDVEAVEALLEAVTQRNRLPFFTRRSLASVLNALHALGFGSHEKVQYLMEKTGSVLDAGSLTDQQLIPLILGQRWSGAEALRRQEMLKRLSMPEKIVTLSDVVLIALLGVLHREASQEPSRLEDCKREVCNRLRNGHPHLLSSYAYYFRSHKIDCTDVLSVMAEESLKEDRSKALLPSQLSVIAYTLASLKWKEKGTLEKLLVLVSHRLDEISEKGLCQSIGVIQWMQWPPTMPPALPILKEATEKLRLMQYAEGSLISIVNSFGRMRLRQRLFTQPVFDEITKLGRLASLTNQELADLLYNMAQMRLKGAKAIDNIKQEILKSNRLPRMKPLEFCTMVYGLGTLRVQEQELTEAVELRMQDVTMRGLRNPELSNLLRGLGGLRCRSASIRKLLDEAVRPERLHDFTSSEFASVVHGTRQLRDVDKETVEALMLETGRGHRLKELTDQQLVHVFTSLTDLTPVHPSDKGPVLPRCLLDAVVDADRLRSYTSYQLADIAAVLAHPAVRCNDFVLEGIASEVVRSDRLKSMKPSDLTIVSRSLSNAGYKDAKTLKAISDEVLNRLTTEKKAHAI